jgi:hypothetical protein
VAAQLKEDPTLEVENVRGRLNELRVEVDGRNIVDSAWYPAPNSIVERVRGALAAGPPGATNP